MINIYSKFAKLELSLHFAFCNYFILILVRYQVVQHMNTETDTIPKKSKIKKLSTFISTFNESIKYDN